MLAYPFVVVLPIKHRTALLQPSTLPVQPPHLLRIFRRRLQNASPSRMHVSKDRKHCIERIVTACEVARGRSCACETQARRVVLGRSGSTEYPTEKVSQTLHRRIDSSRSKREKEDLETYTRMPLADTTEQLIDPWSGSHHNMGSVSDGGRFQREWNGFESGMATFRLAGITRARLGVDARSPMTGRWTTDGRHIFYSTSNSRGLGVQLQLLSISRPMDVCACRLSESSSWCSERWKDWEGGREVSQVKSIAFYG